jgi:hypothetical protein
MSISSIDRAVCPALDLILDPNGFHRKKRTWNRRVGDLIDVIDIQETRWRTAENTQFTLNVGILWPRVFEICWGKRAPSHSLETSCTARIRVGQLSEERRDLWWELEEEEPLDITRISNTLHSVVLPFLAKVETPRQLIDGLKENESWQINAPLRQIYVAIGEALLGDQHAAREGFRAVIRSGDEWSQTARLASERLELRI